MSPLKLANIVKWNRHIHIDSGSEKSHEQTRHKRGNATDEWKNDQPPRNAA